MSRATPMWALVPVRALAEGKTRLAPLLAPEERVALARTMLEDVLDGLGRAPAVEGIVVVTDDPAAAALALDYRALVLPDSPEPVTPASRLNASLEGAAAWLGKTRPGAQAPNTINPAAMPAPGLMDGRPAPPGAAKLIIHADLPAATPEDIAALAAVDADVVLARAGDGGTNALLLRPGVSLPFAFGADSCARHLASARAAGLSARVIERAGLSLDLDRPEDIALYLARAGNSRTLGLLHRLGVPARLRACAGESSCECTPTGVTRALNDAPLPGREGANP